MTDKNIALSLAKTDLQLCISGLELQAASFKRAANNAQTQELRSTYSRYYDEVQILINKIRNLSLEV